MSKTLKLKNYFLVENKRAKSLSAWLSDQMLHGKQSRNRTRFIKLLSERYEEVNGERNRLLSEYCDKNSKKENIYLDKDDKETTDVKLSVKYKISKENLEKLDKEYAEFLDEEYKIDITPANSEIINDVKDIILNTTSQFTGGEAVMYDSWCESFEKINQK
jgi:hypothetical protein